MKTLLPCIVCLVTNLGGLYAEPVHVLVWDERQPRQAEAYDNFLGNEIVAQLKTSAPDLECRSVAS